LIEVSPPTSYKKPESIQKWMDDNATKAKDDIYRKQSFNGGYGQICSIAWAIDNGTIEYSSVSSRDGERQAIQIALGDISDNLGHATNPYLCGHYISGFDLKFIKHRCIVHGIQVPQWLKVNAKPWDESIRDTMILWAGARDTISLDELCTILGIEGKGDVDGSMVYDMWLDGKFKEISEYCAADVEKVRKINQLFLKAGI